MATLRDYFENNFGNLIRFRDKYGIREMIETGTGDGSSISFVKEAIYRIYSFEINTEIYKKVWEKFAPNKDIRIYNTDSVFGLKKLFKYYNFRDPILFFLDAHFPGADFGYAGYEDEKKPDIRIPLQQELEVIVKSRGEDIKKDVFIIDDLRIYEDGPYEEGDWPLRSKIGGDGIEFIYDLFAETHYIKKDYRYQGFVLLTPMK